MRERKQYPIMEKKELFLEYPILTNGLIALAGLLVLVLI
jgi:hypothetical protein